MPDEAYDEEADQTYVKMALGCLHRDKFPRDAFIALVDPKMNPWFDRITMLMMRNSAIQLRQMCLKHHLPTSGVKRSLVFRLREKPHVMRCVGS